MSLASLQRSKPSLGFALSAAILAFMTSACGWLDFGRDSSCPRHFRIIGPAEDWGPPIRDVRRIRFVVAVDVDETAARSQWAASIVAGTRFMLYYTVQDAEARGVQLSDLVTHVAGEAGSRSGRAMGPGLFVLDSALADCPPRLPCHEEYAMTVEFSDEFVNDWGPGTFHWQAELDTATSDFVGEAPACDSGLTRHIAIRSSVIEIVTEPPAGGVDGGSADAAAAAPDGGAP